MLLTAGIGVPQNRQCGPGSFAVSSVATVLTYLLPFLGVIAVIILVHELGHFLVARWCGVRVEAFSLGFGRELCGWTDRQGTRFKLCLLPLGGYVKMFGEQGFVREANGRIRHLNQQERARSYWHKPVAQRAAIVVAGPLVNIVFGVLVILALLLYLGVIVASPTLGTVRADGPAAAAGLLPGDRILTVAGQEVGSFDEIIAAASAHLEQEIDLTVRRGTEEWATQLRPTAMLREGVAVADIGATSSGSERRALDPMVALGDSISRATGFVTANVAGLAEIVSGKRGMEELAGPVQLARVSGEVLMERGVLALVWLTAFLSINVGLVNLLPIPVLDGGHLMFMAIEVVRRQPLSPRLLKVCSLGGLAALIVISVLVTGHDIVSLFG
jgi:regulator of sigma E protease